MITLEEYKARREKLAKMLPKNSIALIFAAPIILRNGDATFRFRQNSDFYYLTGFNEPNALLVIDTSDESKSILFNKPRNEAEEQWTGKLLGQDNAPSQLGVDIAYSIEEIDEHLSLLLLNKDAIYYDISQNENWNKHIFPNWLLSKNQNRHGSVCESFQDLKPLISEMRLIKSKDEIALMKKASEISISAHMRAMQKAKTLSSESELESEILYELNRLGCRNVAYESIVASGNNACTLHYIENNQQLNSKELILIDAGGEYENYAADITRVFPKNGKFSEEQRQIYELVLKAQKAGINAIKPGCPWNEVQLIIVKILTEGLLELEILTGNIDDLIKNEAYKAFYMHGSGHWLGLDVHDCGRYKIDNVWRNLEEGMVLTVEPGLYIQEGSENVDKRWFGIGVRIEDDIVVTKDGYENLTGDLIKEVCDIEEYLSD
jgi:Xaa-Pro aminopeptidase